MQKTKERGKLPLIRINYLDLLEDEPLSSSKGAKAKNPKCTVSTSIRKAVRPVRLPFNPSDWKDVPPNKTKPGTSGSIRRNSASRDVFRKPKNVILKKSDKGVRKDLFGGRSNGLTRASGTFKAASRTLLGPPRTTITELDNTQPLMDIYDAEKQLYQKMDCFRTINNLPTISKNKEAPLSSDIEGSILSPLPLNHSKESLTNVLPEQPEPKPTISPNEYEFLKNEMILNGDTPKIKSCISKTNNNNNSNSIFSETLINLLRGEEQALKRIKNKFKLLEEQFKEIRGDVLAFEEHHNQIVGNLKQHFEATKENHKTNDEWIVTDVNGKRKGLLSAIKSNKKKKNVVFNLNNSQTLAYDANNGSIDNLELEDKGLEKALNFYNTMRKDYKSILTTPKLERSALQTPKSQKKLEMVDSISRRLQRQCLLLLDTPNKDK